MIVIYRFIVILFLNFITRLVEKEKFKITWVIIEKVLPLFKIEVLILLNKVKKVI